MHSGSGRRISAGPILFLFPMRSQWATASRSTRRFSSYDTNQRRGFIAYQFASDHRGHTSSARTFSLRQVRKVTDYTGKRETDV